MKSNYKKLGQYIQQVSIKNSDLKVTNLLGVSITKEFIPSIANTIGTDMSKYKVVKKGQFTYGAITSRNGDKISIALLEEDEAIVSTSYTVFEVIDEKKLLPEYLMMWFRRAEFDRYARYMSHGSTREAFGWDEMCDVELPVPSIEKQREIVKEYKSITDRIKLNEQLNQKLEETAQAIYKEWFVDFEDEHYTLIGEILTAQKGKNITRAKAIAGIFPVVAGGIEPSCYHNDFNTSKPVVTISASGANAGYVNLFENNVWAADCSYIDPKIYRNIYFIYCCLKFNQKLLMSKQIGTGQPHIYPEQIASIPISNYNEEKAIKFNDLVKYIFKNIDILSSETKLLIELKEILLSKLANYDFFEEKKFTRKMSTIKGEI